MIRTNLAVAASVVVLSACAGAAAPAHETAADSAAIQELGTKFQTAWNAKDAAALGALVTDNYYATTAEGTVVSGRTAYEAMEKTEADARKDIPMTIEISRGQLMFLSPTSASSSGTWSIKGAPPGSGPDKGAYLVVSVKGADGQWRMQNALAAAYVPPPAPPTEIKK